MSQQYEEPNHGPSPSASYDRVYEAIPHDNMGRHTEQKISSQNPTVGQRVALVIASLSLIPTASNLAYRTMSDYHDDVTQSYAATRPFRACYGGTHHHP